MHVKPALRWEKMPRKESKPPYSVKLKTMKKELEKAGKEVLTLQSGDPVQFGFSYQPFSDNLIQAAKDGWHMYPGVTSWPNQLRNAIADFERRFRGVDYSSEDVILAPGVAGAFHILHYTLLDAGDEILTIEPCHYLTGPTSYFEMFNSRVVPCSSLEANGWEPDLKEIRANISDKTKGIVVSSPNNPTGAVYNEKVMKSIIDIAGEYDIPVISDEIYGLITFDGIEAKSVAALADDVPVIVLSGMSKIFMRTGWRVGYICFHDQLDRISKISGMAKKVANMYGHPTTCIPTPILVAATRIFQGSIEPGIGMVRQLQVHRNLMWKRLNEIDGISCTKPRGAFYAFPYVHAIEKTWKNDEDFLLELLKEEHMLFAVGSAYGRLGYKHFRTVFLPKLEVLEEICDRLERFMTKHS